MAKGHTWHWCMAPKMHTVGTVPLKDLPNHTDSASNTRLSPPATQAALALHGPPHPVMQEALVAPCPQGSTSSMQPLTPLSHAPTRHGPPLPHPHVTVGEHCWQSTGCLLDSSELAYRCQAPNTFQLHHYGAYCIGIF